MVKTYEGDVGELIVLDKALDLGELHFEIACPHISDDFICFIVLFDLLLICLRLNIVAIYVVYYVIDLHGLILA